MKSLSSFLTFSSTLVLKPTVSISEHYCLYNHLLFPPCHFSQTSQMATSAVFWIFYCFHGKIFGCLNEFPSFVPRYSF